MLHKAKFHLLPLLSQGININGSEIERQIGEVKSGTFKEIVPSLSKFLHLLFTLDLFIYVFIDMYIYLCVNLFTVPRLKNE